MKKTFTPGLDTLLGSIDHIDKVPERIKRVQKKKEIRVTLIVEEELMEKVKAISFWRRLTIKEIINSAISAEIERHELKGKIRAIPKDDTI